LINSQGGYQQATFSGKHSSEYFDSLSICSFKKGKLQSLKRLKMSHSKMIIQILLPGDKKEDPIKDKQLSLDAQLAAVKAHIEDLEVNF